MQQWHAMIDGVPYLVLGCERCLVIERWVGYRGDALRKMIDAAKRRHDVCSHQPQRLIGRAAE